jgi:hypothetical protein
MKRLCEKPRLSLTPTFRWVWDSSRHSEPFQRFLARPQAREGFPEISEETVETVQEFHPVRHTHLKVGVNETCTFGTRSAIQS